MSDPVSLPKEVISWPITLNSLKPSARSRSELLLHVPHGAARQRTPDGRYGAVAAAVVASLLDLQIRRGRLGEHPSRRRSMEQSCMGAPVCA